MSTEKIPVAVIFSGQLKKLRNTKKKVEFSRLLGMTPQNYQRYENGRIPDADILAEIATRCGVSVDWLLKPESMPLPSLGKPDAAPVQGLEKTGTKNFPTVHDPWAQYSLPVQMVKVYGFAQALGARMHKGDLVPDNVFELPTVPVPADGRTYAGFRVEGNSMSPTVRDGMVALADLKAELVNKCIVVCKWDDTLTIKRYRRVGDMIYLTSDNPEAGSDYEVHAREMEWCLRIVKLHVELL